MISFWKFPTHPSTAFCQEKCVHKIVLGRSEMTLPSSFFSPSIFPACIPALQRDVVHCTEDFCASTGGTFFCAVPMGICFSGWFPHENRFGFEMEELGEPMRFPFCCAYWGAGAVVEESAWGEGIGTGAPVPVLLAESQCLGLKHQRAWNGQEECAQPLKRGVCLC